MALPCVARLAGLPPVRERVSARARSLRIEVHTNGDVRLIIPKNVTREDALAFLSSRTVWIQTHLTALRHRPVSAPIQVRWDGTDCLPLRGRTVELRWAAGLPSTAAVRFDNEVVTVVTRPEAPKNHRILVLEKALRRLVRADASQHLAREASIIGVNYLGPRIADQRTRWGSCSQRGLISLNWRLILAPPPVLRYVVMHELCHRRHFDHSRKFWRLLSRHVPDHSTQRLWLREHGAALYTYLPRLIYEQST